MFGGRGERVYGILWSEGVGEATGDAVVMFGMIYFRCKMLLSFLTLYMDELHFSRTNFPEDTLY